MQIASVIQLLLIVCGFLFVIGLIRPGFVVFWTENKSRSSVLAVWGVALLILAISYFIIAGNRKDTFKQGSALPASIIKG